MLDYMNFSYKLANTFGTYPTLETFNYILGLIIIYIAGIAIFGMMIIINEKSKKELKPFIYLITAFTAIAIVILFVYNPVKQNAKKEALKQGITETINFENLKYVTTLHDNITNRNHLNRFSSEYSVNEYKTISIKNNQIDKALKTLNIKSINNFTSNIIYLNKYYDEYYKDDPRDWINYKYDWINEKLNEFYNPENDVDILNDNVLSNLKN